MDTVGLAGAKPRMNLWRKFAGDNVDSAPPCYNLVSWLFLRGIGLIYLAAFASFTVQAMGLIGSQGILPLTDFIHYLHTHLGTERYWLLPMVFWFNASDAAIQAVCWGGIGFSLLLVFNIFPRLSLCVLYILYLSLSYAGQVFMSYQWDTFLVEAGFLALILTVVTMPGIFLLRWLLFRFMFMSGVVKLLSGDPNWRNLSALSYHFLTQPLPTPLAWYTAQIPAEILVLFTGMMFVIELVLPCLFFFPRRFRFVAAFGILLLEFCIFLTGNYNSFNLQTMLMCLPLFDDAALEAILPQRLMNILRPLANKTPPHKNVSLVIRPLMLLIVFCSIVQMIMSFGGRPPAAAMAVNKLISPFHIVNPYGLFAIMTTKRDEIIIEGSDDGIEWKEYTFKYKPGDVKRPALWNIPHQPRLDWQLWFAALQSPADETWFPQFLERILQNSPPVMALMEYNPFPDKPPVYVRAPFYEYTFASPEDKEKGIWWHRRLLDVYFPAVALPKPH